ncbi:hypothetical protein CDAR_194971 [Caerostris darwini]|uniref:Uncharacterized protein n=1 Tax=Caerostris darwini TaxID=1538125 RepID=A0AAV4X5K5_9ARAC|nr:hypothetical protein CDAR_194971 [Caerostris darwini]
MFCGPHSYNFPPHNPKVTSREREQAMIVKAIECTKSITLYAVYRVDNGLLFFPGLFNEADIIRKVMGHVLSGLLYTRYPLFRAFGPNYVPSLPRFHQSRLVLFYGWLRDGEARCWKEILLKKYMVPYSRKQVI